MTVLPGCAAGTGAFFPLPLWSWRLCTRFSEFSGRWQKSANNENVILSSARKQYKRSLIKPKDSQFTVANIIQTSKHIKQEQEEYIIFAVKLSVTKLESWRYSVVKIAW